MYRPYNKVCKKSNNMMHTLGNLLLRVQDKRHILFQLN